MANEEKKDFNAMLRRDNGMPRIQTVTDEAAIRTYGGSRMLLAPPLAYDALMRRVPAGKLTTVGELRAHLARESGADFTDPMTAGIFVSIAAWASFQRRQDPTPYWRTLKAGGQLNDKYPGGALAQAQLLQAEGHAVVVRGRKHLRYYVENYEAFLFPLAAEPDSFPSGGLENGQET